MQVLCKITASADDTSADVQCSVCGQGFHVYWARTSHSEQESTRRTIVEALAKQHTASDATAQAHPRIGFTVPNWSGVAAFSGAALLGGAARSV